MRHIQSIKWTDKNGSQTVVTSSDYDTYEETKDSCIRIAQKLGWPGNPKWWQYWRRNDTKIEEKEK